MKNITYAYSKQDGMVYSRVGGEIAFPVLQYERIGKGGNFNQPFEYELEKCPVLELAYYWPELKWTRKIPATVKNMHRAFWGMAPIRP